MRDTVWAGRPQVMVNANGTAKGLRSMIAERGINTTRMKADDMRVVLSNHDDLIKEIKLVLSIMLKVVAVLPFSSRNSTVN